MAIESLIDTVLHPIDQLGYRENCKHELDTQGALVLPGFLTSKAVSAVASEGKRCQHMAYYTNSDHNVYLQPADSTFADNHPRNRQVSSSKGCITSDQIPANSPLRTLYDSDKFKSFLCAVLGEQSLHEYADPLSSINLHYASQGQELGWHFDNSSFAITLLIQKPEAGAAFEYVKDARDAERGEMNYELAEKVLDRQVPVQSLSMDAGTLVLFRGRNSMHRVSPTQGDTTRMLAVLAYNTEPNVTLSESARMTFYGRLG